MSITAYNFQNLRGQIQVTATSDLPGAVIYHWWVDADYVGASQSPSRVFSVYPGEQVRIQAVDTTDPEFDPAANAPDGWARRRVLRWLRSLDLDARRYRVDQKEAAGEFQTIGWVPYDPAAWEYTYRTRELADLTEYTWRVVPIDAAGNEGDPATVGPELVVRTPDAPSFAISFNPATTKVTISEAA